MFSVKYFCRRFIASLVNQFNAVECCLAGTRLSASDLSTFHARCEFRHLNLDIVRKSDMHSYNTRNKDTIKLPKIQYNWGKQRSRYHCFKDFNELERSVRNSASLPIFKKCLFSTFYDWLFIYLFSVYAVIFIYFDSSSDLLIFNCIII